MRSIDARYLSLLMLIWAVAAVIVDVRGEFPVGDDWAYRFSVISLLQDGVVRLSDWTATSLLSQVYWGALFALPFGASYTALRISTLVAAIIGSFFLYRLLREVKYPPLLVFLSAAVKHDVAQLPRRVAYGMVLAGLLCGCLFSAYAIIATHDDVAGRRVHAGVLQAFVQAGVQRADIDAGWDWNGADQFGLYGKPQEIFTWYRRRDYILGIALDEPGFDVIARYPVPLILPAYKPYQEFVRVQKARTSSQIEKPMPPRL